MSICALHSGEAVQPKVEAYRALLKAGNECSKAEGEQYVEQFFRLVDEKRFMLLAGVLGIRPRDLE